MLGDRSPFLATAPLNAERPPRRHGRFLLGGGIAVVSAVLLAVLFFVPVAQSIPESLTLVNAGNFFSPVAQTVTFPHGGTLDLDWSIVAGVSPTATFSLLGPNGATVYSDDAAGGSATVPVSSGSPYTFEIYDGLSATVIFSGRLHYSSPIL